MGNLIEQKNELLEAVKAPERKKKSPGNGALIMAIVFSNVVFCLLDIISGATVYWMTGFILYGILTFLAGFVPLLLHEFLFVRAFASEDQKKIAVAGAIAALCSIVIIGLLAGYVNVIGVGMDSKNSEIATVAILVLIAAFHAILTAVYFYIDLGIKSDQITAQTVARAMQQADQIRAGAEILNLVSRSVEARKRVGQHFDPDALAEILRQLGRDENRDGIPDILQSRQQSMRQYNSDVRSVPPASNFPGHASNSQGDDPNA